MGRKYRVAFFTLGCKVNQQETAAIEGAFTQSGYTVVPFTGCADIYVVNSCVVTAQAERKSLNIVRRLRERVPDSLVVLAGCFPQTAGEKALDTLADVIVGSNDKAAIVGLVGEALGEARLPLMSVTEFTDQTLFERITDNIEPDRTRAFLKVQDGCEQFCAYCIIPYARGPQRSLPLGDVLRQARALLATGYREIVLTGIRLGAYGRDLHIPGGIASLIEELLALDGLERLRLGSIEPNDIDDRLMDLMQFDDRLCNHLHIPLQSGCDKTLLRMGRKYTTEHFADLVRELRHRVPLIGITTDLIVGFPGETDEEFAETERFLHEISPLRTHLFRYSRRRGTRAALMSGQISEAGKTARAERVAAIARDAAHRNHAKFVGSEVAVLVESESDGQLIGHTGEYVKVRLAGPVGLLRTIVRVRINTATEHCVYAEQQKD